MKPAAYYTTAHSKLHCNSQTGKYLHLVNLVVGVWCVQSAVSVLCVRAVCMCGVTSLHLLPQHNGIQWLWPWPRPCWFDGLVWLSDLCYFMLFPWPISALLLQTSVLSKPAGIENVHHVWLDGQPQWSMHKHWRGRCRGTQADPGKELLCNLCKEKWKNAADSCEAASWQGQPRYPAATNPHHHHGICQHNRQVRCTWLSSLQWRIPQRCRNKNMKKGHLWTTWGPSINASGD